MKNLIKKFVFSTTPTIGYYITALNHRRNFRNLDKNFQSLIAEKLYKNNSIQILSGPFKGLKYINETVWGPITPKWLGSYEEELHNIINSIITIKYDTIIDIGSAEGYYVVGLAKQMPNTNIFSFDVDPISRKQQKKLIQINKLNNITTGNYCYHENLEKLINNKTLIICDIEGYEYTLLDINKVKKLLDTDLLIELHPFEDFSLKRVEEEIRNRFSSTHNIITVGMKNRDINFYFDICEHNLNKAEVKACVDERRSDNQLWFWMTKKI